MHETRYTTELVESFKILQPAPGFVERAPEGLWQAASGAIRDCLQKAGVSGAEVLAVGAAGHGNGLYLLDEEGRILRVWPKVKVKGHAEEVLAAAREA